MNRRNAVYVGTSSQDKSTKNYLPHSVHAYQAQPYYHPSSPTQFVQPTRDSSPNSIRTYPAHQYYHPSSPAQSQNLSKKSLSLATHSFHANPYYQPVSASLEFVEESPNHLARFYQTETHVRPGAAAVLPNQENPNNMSSSKHRIAISSLLNHPNHLSPDPRSSSYGAGSSGEAPRTKTNRVLPPRRVILSDRYDTGEKYECDQCHKIFTQRADVRKHKKTVHEKARDFHCSECPLSFGERGNLNKHIRSIHRKERNFFCDQCDSTFPFRNGLTEHIRMRHTNERPYACPQCPATFKKKSHLHRHETVVHRPSK